MAGKRVILDVDTGIDDALGIILAIKSPELKVEAITTVSGCTTVDSATRNTLLVLDVLNLFQAPTVARGEARPLENLPLILPDVHGSDGLGNIAANSPKPKLTAGSKCAVDIILEIVSRFPQDVTIIATGPMSNIAKAMKKDAEIMKNVKEIIAVGGVFKDYGNISTHSEFNFYVDPHAASIVLNSGIPITLLPLDVTEHVILAKTEVDEMVRKTNTRLAGFIRDFTGVYVQYYRKNEGFEGGYLHGPAAVGVAIHRNLVELLHVRLDVETKGEFTRGMAVADLRKKANATPNVHVAMRIESERFMDFFRKRVWGN
jgi:inosine-uridine nucleoside N-ribohydrolase